MKKNILLVIGGFSLALVLLLGFGLIHIPHSTLVNGYFYSKVPGVKIYCLNQIIRQADTVWDLERISNYSQRVEGSSQLPANYQKQQRDIALKMLRLALHDPNPEAWEWRDTENGMMVALRWCNQITWTQDPKGLKNLQKMVEKYWKLYQKQWSYGEDEIFFVQEIKKYEYLK